MRYRVAAPGARWRGHESGMEAVQQLVSARVGRALGVGLATVDDRLGVGGGGCGAWACSRAVIAYGR